MKNRIILFNLAASGFPLLTLACSAPASRVTPSSPITLARAEPEKKSEFLQIHEINRQKPTKGRFETIGYVAKTHSPPPCPPGADCKPAMPANIIISETNKKLETYDLTEKELILFTEKAASFKVGQKFRFQIEITDHKTTNEALNDVILLSFQAQSAS